MERGGRGGGGGGGWRCAVLRSVDGTRGEGSG